MTFSQLQLSFLCALPLLLALCQNAWSAGAQCEVSSSAENGQSSATRNADALPLCAELYPDYLYSAQASSWRIGFAAGIGERSNPLINSDDIPIYGLIQLSYFGDSFFFDNGDVGWFMAEGPTWSLNAIAGVGGERSFFSFLNEGSIGFNPGLSPGEGDNLGETPGDGREILLVEPDAPDRDYTVDGGLEILYDLGGSEIQLQLVSDISGRHNGQEAWFSWAVPRRSNRWQWTPSVGFNWKSSQAADYYYGVREDEAQPGLPAYQVGSAINPFMRLALSYSFDEHWKLVSVLQYEWLDEEISDSSSVEDDKVQTGFIGLYYEF